MKEKNHSLDIIITNWQNYFYNNLTLNVWKKIAKILPLNNFEFNMFRILKNDINFILDNYDKK